MKAGIGYDIHRLVEGRKLILGGIEIPFNKGLHGHSDADVLIHAIIDALLGACGLGDIGQHFPDTDSRWKDANSTHLLKLVSDLMKNNGFCIKNIDCIIVAEMPKLMPHLQKIKENLINILDISFEQINIKAKTNEGLDSIGKGEAIAAWANVLIDKINI